MSLSAEYLALVLIVVLLLQFFDNGRPQTYFSRFFCWCLTLAIVSLTLNCISVYAINNFAGYSSLIIVLNTFYYCSAILLCSAFALYLFERLLYHSDNLKCLKMVKIIIILSSIVGLSVTFFNSVTGWIFYLDQNGVYHQGAANQIVYFFAAFYIALWGACFIRNRQIIDRCIKKIMYFGAPLVLLIIIFKLIFPSIIINGTITAYVALMIFICFESHKVETDSLTVLSNRGSFLVDIRNRILQNDSFVIMLVSIHHFSAINRSFGYHVGDNVLYAVARWLEFSFRSSKVFRFGPTTFAIMSPYTDPNQMGRDVYILQQRFAQMWNVGDGSCRLNAHFIDLTRKNEQWSLAQIIEFLEYMQRTSKELSNQHISFNKDIFNELEREKYLIFYMREAIEQQLFEVWYQPIYYNKTDNFSTAEALVRLKDKDGTYISPSEFIPIAESNAMIDSISWIVLDNVCAFLSQNPDMSIDSVSVNLAMTQLTDRNLPARLSILMDKWGIAHDRIKFEITERVFASDAILVQEVLRDMVDQGFSFYLDDFGVGYSNFSNMMMFPFECIKLDKSLMDAMKTNDKSCLIVSTLINLFHKSGTYVVAEGIETFELAQKLIDLGADYLQGFYYARPMPKPEILDLLRPRQTI
ncbi:MAG: GGDEF domain-containing protein [Clostridiaceae bacterium]|nr:GGDEF domain-containing protein [Clostridiaceae bacterium]